MKVSEPTIGILLARHPRLPAWTRLKRSFMALSGCNIFLSFVRRMSAGDQQRRYSEPSPNQQPFGGYGGAQTGLPIRDPILNTMFNYYLFVGCRVIPTTNPEFFKPEPGSGLIIFDLHDSGFVQIAFFLNPWNHPSSYSPSLWSISPFIKATLIF